MRAGDTNGNLHERRKFTTKTQRDGEKSDGVKSEGGIAEIRAVKDAKYVQDAKYRGPFDETAAGEVTRLNIPSDPWASKICVSSPRPLRLSFRFVRIIRLFRFRGARRGLLAAWGERAQKFLSRFLLTWVEPFFCPPAHKATEDGAGPAFLAGVRFVPHSRDELQARFIVRNW